MTQKFLYIVQHYVPFPSSEYGGVWNVIAEDDDECFDLITAEDSGGYYEQYYTDLKENVLNSQTFPLAGYIDSGVVESFTT